MKFVVTDGCIGCGMCEGTCPEVFSMNANGVAEAIRDDVADENIEAATSACEDCPVGAIQRA